MTSGIVRLTWWQRLRAWVAYVLTHDLDPVSQGQWMKERAQRLHARHVADLVEAIQKRGIVWDVPEDVGGSGGGSLAQSRAAHREIRVSPVARAMPSSEDVVSTEYARELESTVLAQGAHHRQEIARIRAEHADHLRRIQHGDCISMAAHKQTMAEFRARVQAACPRCGNTAQVKDNAAE